MVLVDSWYLQRKTKCTLDSAVMDDGTTPDNAFFALAFMSSCETTALLRFAERILSMALCTNARSS